MLLPLFDRNPSKRWPLVTLLLIAANGYCFWSSISGTEQDYADTVYERGFIPARLTQLGDPGGVVVEQPIGEDRVLRRELSTKPEDVYPTVFAMMFLHGGWLHLLSNMWMLWVFGDNVEDRLGRGVFVFFYVAGGVVAVLTHWAIEPISTMPVIGASGAVAAVLGAYAVTYPAAKVRTLIFLGIPLIYDLPAALVLGAWFVIQAVMGLQTLGALGAPVDAGATIAFWAHIGGFVAGVVLMPLLTIGAEPADKDWRTETRDMLEF